MKELPANSEHVSKWVWLLAIACVLLVFITILLPRPASDAAQQNSRDSSASQRDLSRSGVERRGSRSRAHSIDSSKPTSEEVVAGKVAEFGRNRREIVHRIARRLGKDV